MKLSGVYNVARDQHSGLAAEQILFGRGFHDLGRRTHAVAWTKDDANEVVRISADGAGSEAYFGLAKALEGNPYMPVVIDHKTLPSKDHIAHIEKLENPSQKHIFPKIRDIRLRLDAGAGVTESEVQWYEEKMYMATMSAQISNFFMSPRYHLDIDSLPAPHAFRAAAEAITDLSMQMYDKNHVYVPIPDMNPTNIMWRKTEAGLHPVLYDAITMTHAHKQEELDHAPFLRSKLGMSTFTSGP